MATYTSNWCSDYWKYTSSGIVSCVPFDLRVYQARELTWLNVVYTVVYRITLNAHDHDSMRTHMRYSNGFF